MIVIPFSFAELSFVQPIQGAHILPRALPEGGIWNSCRTANCSTPQHPCRCKPSPTCNACITYDGLIASLFLPFFLSFLLSLLWGLLVSAWFAGSAARTDVAAVVHCRFRNTLRSSLCAGFGSKANVSYVCAPN